MTTPTKAAIAAIREAHTALVSLPAGKGILNITQGRVGALSEPYRTACCTRNIAIVLAELERQQVEIERMREECREAWKEAAIGWTICGSVHEQWAKGKDAFYTTRHGDFERHAEDSRQRHTLLTHNA